MSSLLGKGNQEAKKAGLNQGSQRTVPWAVSILQTGLTQEGDTQKASSYRQLHWRCGYAHPLPWPLRAAQVEG